MIVKTFLCLLTVSLPVFSQVDFPSPKLKSKSKPKSVQPYALSPALDLPLFGGLLLMGNHAGSRLKETRSKPLDLNAINMGDVSTYDRWAIGFHSPMLSGASSVLAWSQLLIPVAVNAWDTYKGRQPWHGALTDALILQEALMLSSALSSYAKSFPIHSTPLTYDAGVNENEKRIPQNVSSFFSNHTASAFTTAVFTGYTYQLRHPGSPLVPWVWGASLTMATGVGGLRILAGKHFPSDVVAGAAVGALCGYLVPRMHLRIPSLRIPVGVDPEKSRPTPEGRKLDVKFGVTFPGGATTPTPTMSVDF